MSAVTLMLGDCLERFKELPAGSVDMVLCDPPYGTTACKWDSVIPFAPMWAEIKRVAKKNAAICLFGSEPFSSQLRMSNIKDYRYDWYWLKNRGGGFVTAKLRPLSRVETVSVFYASQPSYYPTFEPYSASTQKRFAKNPFTNASKAIASGKTNNLQNIKTIGAQVYLERGKYPSNYQTFSVPDPQNGARFHPTQKPVALLEYLIRTYTLPAERVLDFTMGSGSTGVACVNTGRAFTGIELDANYFAIAEKRITDAQAAQSLPLEVDACP